MAIGQAGVSGYFSRVGDILLDSRLVPVVVAVVAERGKGGRAYP
jgi:hypothetical protein